MKQDGSAGSVGSAGSRGLGSLGSVDSADSLGSLGSVRQSVSGLGQRWTFLAVVLPRATNFTRLSPARDYTDVTLACEDG